MKYTMYAKNFRSRRKELLRKANNRCERCGVANRSIAFNSEEEIYIIYLHAAHVFREQKGNPDALFVLLCPKCHYFFDHPRGDTPDGLADWAFIGSIVARTLGEPDEQTQEEAWTA